jgi:hypothetical protein
VAAIASGVTSGKSTPPMPREFDVRASTGGPTGTPSRCPGVSSTRGVDSLITLALVALVIARPPSVRRNSNHPPGGRSMEARTVNSTSV